MIGSDRVLQETAASSSIQGEVQVAFMFRSENKTVDKELERLRKLDPAPGKEMEDYRKNYVGGQAGVPVNLDQ